MKKLTFALALLAVPFVLAGCGNASSSSAPSDADPLDTGSPADATGGVDVALDSGAPAADASPTTDTTPSFDAVAGVPASPIISRGQPAFASAGEAANANDANPAVAWEVSKAPAWLAYDLSKVPIAQRQAAFVAWNSIHAGCYIATDGSGMRPLDYVLELNDAAGGASAPPTSGWTTAVSITGNRYCGREHVLDLKGANWIRLSVSKGTSDGVALDLDVHSAPGGPADAWLFMGDSITAMTVPYAFSNLPALVTAAAKDHTPAVIDAAIGGTNTETAVAVIDDTMRDFPGRFVVLAYGTNDDPANLEMEELVQHVLAAGKTPVVPHMPWASDSTKGPTINAAIDALYAKYPAIVRGPDFWKSLEGHTEWIPVGDVHPNAAGQDEMRKQWATAMTATYGK